jgi:hypothetical protein
MVEHIGVEANRRHQLQELGVVRFGFEGSPATRLGFEEPSGAQLVQYGIMDRGDVAVPSSNQVEIVFEVWSSLATVHLRFGIDFRYEL